MQLLINVPIPVKPSHQKGAMGGYAWYSRPLVLLKGNHGMRDLYVDSRIISHYIVAPWPFHHSQRIYKLFLSLDLLWKYRIQHGANGPLHVTSSYSTWIFCRGVSGFATDCPCDVWCRGLTTCILHVGPPFGNQTLNNSWAVGLT